MRKRKVISLALFCFFAFCLMNFRCYKDVPYRPLQYEFSEKLQLYPLKDLYHTNDTIWIELLKQSKRLYDIKSNRTIALDTGIITFGLNITPLYSTPQNPADGLGDFVVFDASKFDRTAGGTFPDMFGIFLKKECSEPNFHFRIGFVPKYKGYYALSVGRSYVADCSGSPDSSLFAEIAYSFDINNRSKAVYLQIPDSVRKKYAYSWLENGLDGTDVYAIKVE